MDIFNLADQRAVIRMKRIGRGIFMRRLDYAIFKALGGLQGIKVIPIGACRGFVIDQSIGNRGDERGGLMLCGCLNNL